MNSFGTLFHDKIFSLTFPWLLTTSLTFPWHVSNILTFPGFPDSINTLNIRVGGTRRHKSEIFCCVSRLKPKVQESSTWIGNQLTKLNLNAVLITLQWKHQTKIITSWFCEENSNSSFLLFESFFSNLYISKIYILTPITCECLNTKVHEWSSVKHKILTANLHLYMTLTVFRQLYVPAIDLVSDPPILPPTPSRGAEPSSESAAFVTPDPLRVTVFLTTSIRSMTLAFLSAV